ncbi:unnamed protein product, partial [Sphacelaria rigidula]
MEEKKKERGRKKEEGSKTNSRRDGMNKGKGKQGRGGRGRSRGGQSGSGLEASSGIIISLAEELLRLSGWVLIGRWRCQDQQAVYNFLRGGMRSTAAAAAAAGTDLAIVRSDCGDEGDDYVCVWGAERQGENR